MQRGLAGIHLHHQQLSRHALPRPAGQSRLLRARHCLCMAGSKGAAAARGDQQLQEYRGDVVTVDSEGQKTAAASSRGQAGFPEKPEDMQQSTPAANSFMQERIDYVKRDFQNCWKNSLTKDNFTEDIYFEDPISKYTNFTGYRANITFLRNFLAPIYEIHDVRQSPENDNEIWCKWTFSMQFWWLRYFPFSVLTKPIWDPRLVFTGITVLGVDPKTGKINKHVDQWDNNRDNSFFSLEAFLFVQRQLLNLSKPPDLATPEFCILKKFHHHEIRRYKPLVIAETSMQAGDSDSDSGGAFKRLAGYLGKGNSEAKEMSMTTPVFTDSKTGNMAFYIAGDTKDVQDLPSPKDGSVELQRLRGGLWAATVFQGNAKRERVEQKARELMARCGKDGLTPPALSDQYLVARYNVPWQLPFFKRNEVLIPVDESKFQLWAGTGAIAASIMQEQGAPDRGR